MMPAQSWSPTARSAVATAYTGLASPTSPVTSAPLAPKGSMPSSSRRRAAAVTSPSVQAVGPRVRDGDHQVEAAIARLAQRADVVEQVVLDQRAVSDDQVGTHASALPRHGDPATLGEEYGAERANGRVDHGPCGGGVSAVAATVVVVVVVVVVPAVAAVVGRRGRRQRRGPGRVGAVVVTAAVVGTVVVPVPTSGGAVVAGPTTTPSSTSSSAPVAARGARTRSRAAPSSISRVGLHPLGAPAEVDLDLAAGRLLDLDRPPLWPLGLNRRSPVPSSATVTVPAPPASTTRVAPVARRWPDWRRCWSGWWRRSYWWSRRRCRPRTGRTAPAPGRGRTRGPGQQPPAGAEGDVGTGELHGGSFASVGCRTPPCGPSP